ncbi:MAG: DUF885 family protein [Actinomycetes bacterium]
MEPRLRAVCDLLVPGVREGSGLHEYDGEIADLSPAGVDTALARLRVGSPLPAAHDEAHLTAFENGLRVAYGEYAAHRRNPLVHLDNLDLACYDRPYAPEAERAEARSQHLRRWPDAVDMAIASLDAVSAPVAESLLEATKGLAAGLDADAGPDEAAALAAHARLVAHVAHAAETGDPDPSVGGRTLARLMGAPEGLEVDLDDIADRADAERDRLRAMLDEACRALDPTATTPELVASLQRDHPDAADVLDEARALTAEVLAFSSERRLAPYLDGVCEVGPAPESRRWAVAMMSWSAPGEPDGPSWYHVTPPDASWPAEDVESWLEVFSRTTLPAVTVHEVAPGHFAHGRALRRASTPVRRLLHSMAFAEGWAHYVEEVCVEEGFRAGDPRYAIGVCVEALVRVTRLACALGLHTGAMTVPEAATRFTEDAFLSGQAALSEARRGTFDPTYGCYTWGKLAILELREEARARWGTGFGLPRFHTAMLALGSPPLGLLGAALDEVVPFDTPASRAGS